MREGYSDECRHRERVVRGQLAKREQEILRLGAQLELSRAQQFSNVQLSGRPAGVFRDEEPPADLAESIHQLPIARQRISQLEYQIDCLQEHIDFLEKERSSVEEERAIFKQGFEDQVRVFQQELEKEREKSATLLRATAKMEKLVDELDTLKKNQIDYSSLERTKGREIAALHEEITQLKHSLLEKTARVATLERDTSRLLEEVSVLKSGRLNGIV
ncbi:hypothetical protein DFJ73DRAFT_190585 [Zopfochytrium polystomum]|nr:hypothetical protein DFJ73DRAFT_190585 [Zopfochytrium polystomum]